MNRRTFFLALLAPFSLALSKLFPKPKSKFQSLANGQWKVYQDDGTILVGYKGKSFYEAGYFYAPYIPLQFQNAATADAFHAKHGPGTPIEAY